MFAAVFVWRNVAGDSFMQNIRLSNWFWRPLIGLCAGGALLGAGCEKQALDALTAGLQAAAQQLQDQDENISFGDWLQDEIEDW